MKNLLTVLLVALISCEGKVQPNRELASLSDSPPNNTVASAQSLQKSSGVFEWDSEMCANRGTYDTSKYTERQIADTHFLGLGYNYVTAMEVDATVERTEDYNRDHVLVLSAKLDGEYMSTMRRLKGLEVVPTEYWLGLKRQTISQLEELYRLMKVTVEAHNSPVVLLGSPYAEGCRSYAEALASEDSTQLLKAWRVVVDGQKAKNGSPESVERRFQEQLNSPGRLIHARIYLMTYGWWNCANRQRRYVDGFNQEGKVTHEFERLFTKVESECDEEE